MSGMMAAQNRVVIGMWKRSLSLALAATIWGTAGCQSEGAGERLSIEGRELFARGGAAGGTRADQWSIVIVAYELGEELSAQRRVEVRNQAALALERVRETGLSSAFMEERGERIVLGYGRYAGPDDPEALSDLARVKSIEWRGIRPFASAVLAPPSQANLGSYPDLNLLTIRERFGDKARYSLQVIVYGRADREQPTRADLALFREAAEQGTVQLRREGELAFYHHGANTSSVTIGVFGDADYRIDFDSNSRKTIHESSRLRELKRRFPHLLLNGRTILLPGVSRDGSEVVQRTDLIAIPGSSR